MNYTKGEWKPDKRSMHTVTFNTRYTIRSNNNGKPISILIHDECEEANAHLIAAAPKLCELAQAIKDNLALEIRLTDDTFGYGVFIREVDLQKYIKAIDEVLAIAEGKEVT